MRAATGLDGDDAEAEGAILGVGFNRRAIFSFHAIDGPYHQKHGERYDNKADDSVDEKSVVEGNRSGSSRRGQGSVGTGGFGSFFQCNEKVGEIDMPQEQTEGGHQNIAYERLDNGPESRADNDTYSHVYHVAPHGEFLELFEHSSSIPIR